MELDAAIKLRNNYSNLKKEAALSSETSVFVPDDGLENYITSECQTEIIKKDILLYL